MHQTDIVMDEAVSCVQSVIIHITSFKVIHGPTIYVFSFKFCIKGSYILPIVPVGFKPPNASKSDLLPSI